MPLIEKVTSVNKNLLISIEEGKKYQKPPTNDLLYKNKTDNLRSVTIDKL
jgi:hypothetical protein